MTVKTLLEVGHFFVIRQCSIADNIFKNSLMPRYSFFSSNSLLVDKTPLAGSVVVEMPCYSLCQCLGKGGLRTFKKYTQTPQFLTGVYTVRNSPQSTFFLSSLKTVLIQITCNYSNAASDQGLYCFQVLKPSFFRY